MTTKTVSGKASQTIAKTASSSTRKDTNHAFKDNFMKGETMMKEGLDKTKEGFERASETFKKAQTFGKDNLDAITASATVAGKGMESLGTGNFAYAKESFETALSAAQSITSAKNPQEAFELQTDYARNAMERYFTQVNESAQRVAETYKDAFQPLSSHWKQSLESFQN